MKERSKTSEAQQQQTNPEIRSPFSHCETPSYYSAEAPEMIVGSPAQIALGLSAPTYVIDSCLLEIVPNSHWF